MITKTGGYIMTLDSVLKTLGIRRRSLAERVTIRILSGFEPSDMAKTVVGKLSDKQINEMMQKAKLTSESKARSK